MIWGWDEDTLIPIPALSPLAGTKIISVPILSLQKVGILAPNGKGPRIMG